MLRPHAPILACTTLLSLILSTSAQAQALRPTINQIFLPNTVNLGGTTILALIISNPNSATALAGVTADDLLPAGLTLSLAGPTDGGCSPGSVIGPVIAAVNTGLISVGPSQLAANGSCFLHFSLQANTAGVLENTAMVADAVGLAGIPSTATLTVRSAPSIAKVFNPATITAGATSLLTFTVTNPNPTIPLTGVTFTDTFPASLVLTATGPQSASCTVAGSTLGGVAATAGGSSVALGATTLGPGGSCTFSVLFQGTAAGALTNRVTVSDIVAGTGNTAAAGVQVNAPLPPLLTKAFGAAAIGLNGITPLTFTFTNPNATVGLTGVGVVDVLPPGLSVAMPTGAVSTCNGPITALGSLITIFNSVSLAAGASCTVTVNVTGTVIGPVTNTTQAVLSANAGNGLAASAILFMGDPFQIRYTANLPLGDSVINFTNTGQSSTAVENGNLCVNVFAFSPDEQLVSCCSCLVTPDGLNSISANNDLASNTFTPGRPTSLVVKLIATSASAVAPSCTASTAGTPENPLANGLSAWGTTVHPISTTAGSPPGTLGITETRFVSAQLSTAELTRMTTLCSFIQISGSGFGICRSCRLGGQGGSIE